MAKGPTKVTDVAEAATPAEEREFTVISPVEHDGVAYAPGDPITLTREAWLPLYGAQAVDGGWVVAPQDEKSEA